eukprot:Gregarina_sp_Pseudo_9__5719@NODE_828_length_2156_cov_4_363722_g777_i0_p2_GENE_NODE_828_length_2156_cov_4_363722_g777_i0NODE_828_length_2156_cov_4_363722_g777_i0_p2_ORF_typecomplete_len174_score4_37DUF778/PF05608_12/1_3e31DUF4796/PF16044_5/6_8e05Peptidase_C97/PF05903_14/0_00048LRAT/PF04970_13/0_00068DUF4105/PF13387_6/0_0075GP41/PF00517_17/0_044Metal_resist/PF13801_6/0_34_NODE_828_length_2156_cov_4_363722_g777_i02523
MFDVSVARTPVGVDIEHNLFPYSVVWTKLPAITALVPLIGHTGIGDSKGTISDFAASFTIGRKRLVFGPVKRYWVLQLDEEQRSQWDQAVKEANELFSTRKHNLFTNNCHHHVAEVLNRLQYQGHEKWGAVRVCYGVWFKGHWKTKSSAVSVLIPFAVVLCVVLVIVFTSIFI